MAPSYELFIQWTFQPSLVYIYIYIYIYGYRLKSQTKIFSWNVIKWGLFFSIVPLVVHMLFRWCRDHISKRSHQQRLWHHHMNFSSNELFSPAWCIYIYIYMDIGWKAKPKYSHGMWSNGVYFSALYPFWSTCHFHRCRDHISKRSHQQRLWHHHMNFSSNELFSPAWCIYIYIFIYIYIWISVEKPDQNILMECDQMGFTFQHCTPCGPHAIFTGAEITLVKEVTNRGYDTIIWTFHPMNFSAQPVVYIYIYIYIGVYLRAVL